MTQPTAEQTARARRIAVGHFLNPKSDRLDQIEQHRYAAALAAIIETQEACAKVAEAERKIAFNEEDEAFNFACDTIAHSIRSGLPLDPAKPQS